MMMAMSTVPSLHTLLSRLSFRQLRLLTAIADHRSLSKACEIVALTQPGASKALGEMEVAFETQLFTRTSRGLVPTPFGTIAIRYARLMCTDMAHMRDEMLGAAQGRGGRLSIGVIMGAVPLLTRAVNAFLASHDDVSIEIVEDTSEYLLKLLEEGRVSMAICRSAMSAHPERFDARFLQHETLSVIANVQHPLMGHRHVHLSDLAAYRWVVYSANMPMRLLLEREFAAAGLRLPANLLETTSALVTLSLINGNRDLLALLSSEVAQQLTQTGMARAIDYRIQSVSEPYEIVTRRQVDVSHLARDFMVTLLAQTADVDAVQNRGVGRDLPA